MTELKFRIINSAIGKTEREIEFEGQPGVVTVAQLHIDAEPLSGTVKTLELTLPADLADAFPEGGIITATLTCEKPLLLDELAAPESPALEA